MDTMKFRCLRLTNVCFGVVLLIASTSPESVIMACRAAVVGARSQEQWPFSVPLYFGELPWSWCFRSAGKVGRKSVYCLAGNYRTASRQVAKQSTCR
jgi:hypothetical protein